MLGIISDIITCPQCGMPAQQDRQYITSEEFVTCDYCGYTHAKTFDGKETRKGYGCIHYVREGESGIEERTVRLKAPLSLLGKSKVVQELHSLYDIKKSSFYIWDEAKNAVETIVGEKPISLEERYERQRLEDEYITRLQTAQYPEDLC